MCIFVNMAKSCTCTCEELYTWEIIDTSDKLYFTAPLLNQGLHKVLVSKKSYESFSDCFDDAFWACDTGEFVDRCIGVYHYHAHGCFLRKRRYTLSSSNALVGCLDENPNLFTYLCNCSKNTSKKWCKPCLDKMLCTSYGANTRKLSLLKELMSVQSEYEPWYCASVDFHTTLDDVWTGSMAYTCPQMQQEEYCFKAEFMEYTLYRLDYNKQKLNVYTERCGFCHVPMRYPTLICRECFICIEYYCE